MFGLSLLTMAVAGGLLCLVWKPTRARASYLVAASLALAMLALLGVHWRSNRQKHSDNKSTRPVVPLEVAGGNDPYASSSRCQSCHESQYDSWHASYHRTMTQTASPRSVIADFDNVRVNAYQQDFHLSRQGDTFWVNMPDPADSSSTPARRIDRQIVLTTGSHHMQVYWYATPKDRRLGQLPVVWLRDARRWVPIHSIFIRPPQQHADPVEGRWNHTCIKCHVTQGRPRIDASKTIPVDTHVAEFGIACEACHGPGSDHVTDESLAQESGTASISGEATIVHPESLPHDRSAEICGQCHGVWLAADAAEARNSQWNGLSYRPGDKLSDTRHVFLSQQPRSAHVNAYLESDPTFVEDRFWPDGMVRVSGREYNGLIGSPCFQRGTLSCLSCHQLHADDGRDKSEWADDLLADEMRTNAACLQCHTEFQDAGLLTQHTHHAATSTGSQCYNCHMPYTTYGLLKAIRSHQISSPNVQESVDVGRPNACNQCHIDKTLPWTAVSLRRWYGIEPPRQFSEDQQIYSATLLWCLTGDAGQRALATWTLGWKPAQEASRHDWAVPVLGQLLDDPYDAVRYLAHRSLGAQPGYERFSFDFLGTSQYRDQASVRAFLPWRESQLRRKAAADPALLIAPGGDLMHQEFTRLLGQRDDRVVVLNE